MKTCLKTLQTELENKAPSDSSIQLEMEQKGGIFFMNFRLCSYSMKMDWEGEHHDEETLVDELRGFFNGKIESWWETRNN